jgi:hypothetical protein
MSEVTKATGSSAKKLATASLILLSAGALYQLKATNCNSYWTGACDQWCVDRGHSGSYCVVTNSDAVVCVCDDGSSTCLSGC